MREIKFRATWKGEVRFTTALHNSYKQHGYVKRKVDWHPNSDKRGYVMEHRLVMEEKIGEYLPKHAVIHHLNGIRDDNRIENLEYMPEQSKHSKQHDTGKRNKNGQFVATSPEFQNKKFRLLNKNTGLMQVFSLAKLIGTTFRNSQFEYRGEWTGLKDKNGKEIYEGDIVQQGENAVNRGVVEYKTSNPNNYFINGYVLVTIGDEWIDFNNKCEVIGNVWEHPELLGEK